MVKKISSEGGAGSRTTGGRNEIRLPSSPVKLLVLHVGLKMEICEVGMGANLGEKCFNFYESL